MIYTGVEKDMHDLNEYDCQLTGIGTLREIKAMEICEKTCKCEGLDEALHVGKKLQVRPDLLEQFREKHTRS